MYEREIEEIRENSFGKLFFKAKQLKYKIDQ